MIRPGRPGLEREGYFGDKLLIAGDGDAAVLARRYFARDYGLQTVAFIVEQEYKTKDAVDGVPVITFDELTESEEKYCPWTHWGFAAVGNGKLNRTRAKLYALLKEWGDRIISYVSPYAYIDTDKIGENCFIFENNVVQHNVTIGDNVVLWSGNHVGHDTVIHDNVFVASHAAISGHCVIEENCFLGTNCTLGDNVRVGKDTIVGAGAVLTHDALPGKIYKNKKAEASDKSSYEASGLKAK
jgi:sugar O-acyltransferase (sialic acid O-acetyltransferase NeuD family)